MITMLAIADHVVFILCVKNSELTEKNIPNAQ